MKQREKSRGSRASAHSTSSAAAAARQHKSSKAMKATLRREVVSAASTCFGAAAVACMPGSSAPGVRCAALCTYVRLRRQSAGLDRARMHRRCSIACAPGPDAPGVRRAILCTAVRVCRKSIAPRCARVTHVHTSKTAALVHTLGGMRRIPLRDPALRLMKRRGSVAPAWASLFFRRLHRGCAVH